MKFHVIGDEDTVLGFRFAGISGDVVDSPAQTREVFTRVMSDTDVGVIIMTEHAADSIAEEVNRVLYEATRPVVVRIPGPDGPAPGRKSLQKLIEEAVGMRL